MQGVKYYKLQEFQAHTPTVNCASIGRQSQGVIVTGGDDRLVNLWTIGTEQRVMSLQGHQSAVESVTFDNKEVLVAAGSASGAIKVFDLEASKVNRSLPGHKCNVRCLDFKDNNLVSGSNDTNIKYWDTRQHNAAVTCKGHNSPVLRVRLSPDGKWVASGDQEGQVKIFDLASGRVLHEYNQHTHPITGLEFHPTEYLMATSSADKTVKVWDLDSQRLLESTPQEATGVRAMAFHPDGRHLFAALQDGLRVWQWEPSPPLQHDNVDIPWSKVNDIAVWKDKNKLVGCSFSSAFCGVWVVHLDKVSPFKDRPQQVRQSHPLPTNSSASAVTPAYRHGPSPSQGRYGGVSAPGDSAGSVSASASAAVGVNGGSGANMHDFALRRNGQMGAGAYGAAGQVVAAQRGPTTLNRALEPTFQNLRVADDRRKCDGLAESTPPSDYDPPSRPSHQPPPRPPGDLPAAPPPAPAHMVSVGVGVGDSLLRDQAPPGALRQMVQQAVSSRPVDSLGDAIKASHGIQDLITSRHHTLRQMNTSLRKGDLRGAMQTGRRAADPMPGADLLGALQRRRGFNDLLDLTCLPELVPMLEVMLGMQTDKHVQTAVDTAQFVCKNLGHTIRDVCSAAVDNKRLAVDMAFEQRKAKCEAARLVLQGFRSKLAAVSRQHAAGSALRLQMTELSEQLAQTCLL